MALFSLVVSALTFSADASAQRKNEATAELSGAVNGADGAPVVLQLRALDGNPVRYYDDNDAGEVNVRVLPDASLPIAEPSVGETGSKSKYPDPTVVLFPDPMSAQAITNAGPGLDFTVQWRLFRSMTFGDRNNPTLQIVAVPTGHDRTLAIQGPGLTGSPLG